MCQADINSFTPDTNAMSIPISQMKIVRHRNVDDAARKWQSQDLNPASLALKFILDCLS